MDDREKDIKNPKKESSQGTPQTPPSGSQPSNSSSSRTSNMQKWKENYFRKNQPQEEQNNQKTDLIQTAKKIKDGAQSFNKNPKKWKENYEKRQVPAPKRARRINTGITGVDKKVDDIRKTIKTIRMAVNVARAIIGMSGGTLGLIIGLIFLFIVIYLLFFGGGGSLPFGSNSASPTPAPSSGGSTYPPIPGLTLTLIGPEIIANGELLKYTVETSYDSSQTLPIENITIFNDIPPGTSFSASNSTGSFTESGSQVSWPLSNPDNRDGFIIVLDLDQNDILVSNKVYARATGGSESGNTDPTATDCGNPSYAMYLQKIAGGLNFGDPNCDFDRSKLYTLLEQIDPLNADAWYACAQLESSYIPVAYAGHAEIGTPDPGGAWGLFQMGQGNKRPTDNGRVVWTQQATNAVADSKLYPSFKDYWQCFRDLNYDGIR